MRSLVIPVAVFALTLAAGCKKPTDDTSSTGTVASTGAATPAAASGTMTGTWSIASATNPSGKGTYAGKVKIGEAAGYQTVDWSIADSPPYAGVAISRGDKLGVGWGMGGNYGVAVYEIAGGKLTGTWTAKGLSGVGDEDLDGPASLDGVFTIGKTRTPQGKSYTGTVTIKPTGKTYSVSWATSAGSYTGVAIKDGNLLVAGWGTGGKGAGVVLYTKKTSGDLEGVWATPGGTALGSETLHK